MPLCDVIDMDEEEPNNCGPVESMQCSIDDQLELICNNKTLPPVKPTPDKEDDFEKHYTQLELEDLGPKSSLNLCQDKENRDCGGAGKGCFAFSPDTSDGSLMWPCTHHGLVYWLQNVVSLSDVCQLSLSFGWSLY